MGVVSWHWNANIRTHEHFWWQLWSQIAKMCTRENFPAVLYITRPDVVDHVGRLSSKYSYTIGTLYYMFKVQCITCPMYYMCTTAWCILTVKIVWVNTMAYCILASHTACAWLHALPLHNYCLTATNNYTIIIINSMYSLLILSYTIIQHVFNIPTCMHHYILL